MHDQPPASDPPLDRRAFVGGAGALAVGALFPGRTAHEDPAMSRQPTDPTERHPAAFVSHGAPTLALDAEKGGELRRWAAAMPRPRACVVVSAHWEATPLAVGTSAPERLLYDFGGFDPALRDIRYRAPGAPELAERVAASLGGTPRRDGRMWDHGVWVPLVHMFPGADVPVLQVSLPSRAGPRAVFDVGRTLRPLRDEGVLLLASGGMVHNLGALDWDGDAPPPGWATAFEAWARASLEAWDLDALVDFERRAPDARRAHPTHEHYLPLLVAAGAAHPGERVAFPVGGFEYGSLSRTAVQLG